MAKAKATPEWKRLIERCQRLWEAYDKAPTKKRLEAFGAHIEKMKASKSAKVKAERTRAVRAFREEWKRQGYKSPAAKKKTAKRKTTKKKTTRRRRKNPEWKHAVEGSRRYGERVTPDKPWATGDSDNLYQNLEATLKAAQWGGPEERSRGNSLIRRIQGEAKAQIYGASVDWDREAIIDEALEGPSAHLGRKVFERSYDNGSMLGMGEVYFRVGLDGGFIDEEGNILRQFGEPEDVVSTIGKGTVIHGWTVTKYGDLHGWRDEAETYIELERDGIKLTISDFGYEWKEARLSKLGTWNDELGTFEGGMEDKDLAWQERALGSKYLKSPSFAKDVDRVTRWANDELGLTSNPRRRNAAKKKTKRKTTRRKTTRRRPKKNASRMEELASSAWYRELSKAQRMAMWSVSQMAETTDPSQFIPYGLNSRTMKALVRSGLMEERGDSPGFHRPTDKGLLVAKWAAHAKGEALPWDAGALGGMPNPRKNAKRNPCLGFHLHADDFEPLMRAAQKTAPKGRTRRKKNPDELDPSKSGSWLVTDNIDWAIRRGDHNEKDTAYTYFPHDDFVSARKFFERRVLAARNAGDDPKLARNIDVMLSHYDTDAGYGWTNLNSIDLFLVHFGAKGGRRFQTLAQMWPDHPKWWERIDPEFLGPYKKLLRNPKPRKNAKRKTAKKRSSNPAPVMFSVEPVARPDRYTKRWARNSWDSGGKFRVVSSKNSRFGVTGKFLSEGDRTNQFRGVILDKGRIEELSGLLAPKHKGLAVIAGGFDDTMGILALFRVERYEGDSDNPKPRKNAKRKVAKRKTTRRRKPVSNVRKMSHLGDLSKDTDDQILKSIKMFRSRSGYDGQLLELEREADRRGIGYGRPPFALKIGTDNKWRGAVDPTAAIVGPDFKSPDFGDDIVAAMEWRDAMNKAWREQASENPKPRRKKNSRAAQTMLTATQIKKLTDVQVSQGLSMLTASVASGSPSGWNQDDLADLRMFNKEARRRGLSVANPGGVLLQVETVSASKKMDEVKKSFSGESLGRLKRTWYYRQGDSHRWMKVGPWAEVKSFFAGGLARFENPTSKQDRREGYERKKAKKRKVRGRQVARRIRQAKANPSVFAETRKWAERASIPELKIELAELKVKQADPDLPFLQMTQGLGLIDIVEREIRGREAGTRKQKGLPPHPSRREPKAISGSFVANPVEKGKGKTLFKAYCKKRQAFKKALVDDATSGVVEKKAEVAGAALDNLIAFIQDTGEPVGKSIVGINELCRSRARIAKLSKEAGMTPKDVKAMLKEVGETMSAGEGEVEAVAELLLNPGGRRRRNASGRLSAAAKRKINADLIAAGFDGNGRFKTMTAALSTLKGVLSKHGIEEDEVFSADRFRYPSGQESFRVAFSNREEPMSPQSIDNASISWQWHRHKDTTDLYEIVSYVG